MYKLFIRWIKREKSRERENIYIFPRWDFETFIYLINYVDVIWHNYNVYYNFWTLACEYKIVNKKCNI